MDKIKYFGLWWNWQTSLIIYLIGNLDPDLVLDREFRLDENIISDHSGISKKKWNLGSSPSNLTNISNLGKRDRNLVRIGHW